jgi:hypothetical protein
MVIRGDSSGTWALLQALPLSSEAMEDQFFGVVFPQEQPDQAGRS